jgi:hypothetical protein
MSYCHSLSSAASSGASVLSTDSNIPPVTKTPMGSDLLESLNIITELGGNVLRKDLTVLSRLEILLTIQKPKWDFELTGVLDDGHDLFNFVCGKLTGTLINIDFGLFANQI